MLGCRLMTSHAVSCSFEKLLFTLKTHLRLRAQKILTECLQETVTHRLSQFCFTFSLVVQAHYSLLIHFQLRKNISYKEKG